LFFGGQRDDAFRRAAIEDGCGLAGGAGKGHIMNEAAAVSAEGGPMAGGHWD
jgi:hypothetical protein